MEQEGVYMWIMNRARGHKHGARQGSDGDYVVGYLTAFERKKLERWEMLTIRNGNGIVRIVRPDESKLKHFGEYS